MRICRIADIFPSKEQITGDLGPNYYYYSKLLAEKGFDVRVICKQEGPWEPEYEERDGVKIYRLPVKTDWESINYGGWAKGIFQKVLELKPDIIHGHNSFHLSLIKKREALHRKGIEIITHLHGAIDGSLLADKLPLSFSLARGLSDRLSFRQAFLERAYVSRHADYVIACDQYTANSVLDRFPEVEDRMGVAYNGVDLKVFRPILSDFKKENRIDKLLLSIGRPVPFKGFKYLLEGLVDLNKEVEGLKLLLLGVKRKDFNYDIYYRWLLSIIRKLRLKNVELWGAADYFHLPEFYCASDCFVTAAYPDSSPKTIYEAQACNTPVVAPDGGGIPEIFSDGSGCLFEPRNTSDMVEKILKVLEHPKLYNKGRKAIEKIATWETCVKSIINCYEAVTGYAKTS